MAVHFLHFIHRIAERSNRDRAALLNRLGNWKLDSSHGEIVLFLVRKKEASMLEIAGAIHRDKSTVTALVRKLTEAGILVRADNAEDRRRVPMRLTGKGRTLGRAILSAQTREALFFSGGLTVPEQKKLASLLLKVYNATLKTDH